MTRIKDSGIKSDLETLCDIEEQMEETWFRYETATDTSSKRVARKYRLNQERIQEQFDAWATEAAAIAEQYEPDPKITDGEQGEATYERQRGIAEDAAKIHNHAYYIQFVADAFPNKEQLDELSVPMYG